MGTIRETYVLEDKVSSPLDNIIDKMTATVSVADQMATAGTSAADQMAEAATNMVSSSDAVENAVESMASATTDTADKMTENFTEVSDATQDLIDQLSGYERAIAGAFTDSEADAYLESLQSKMQRLGLVWTNAADQMEAADMLVRVGLQQLAEQGSLAASALAEEAYAAQQAAEAEQEHVSILQRLVGGLGNVASGATSAVSALLGFNGVKSPLNSLTSQIGKMALSFFTVRKIISYITDAIGNAPEAVAESFTTLQSTVSDAFSRTVVSAMEAMQSGIEKITDALNSDSGQKFLRGLEAVSRAAGAAVGYLAEKVAMLIEWLGDNFQTVATAAVGVLAIFAAGMIASAVATAMAKAPLLLFIAILATVVARLLAAGVTAEEIFSGIGAAAGWLYALVYNIVADAYNLFASLAEFLANVFNDPVTAIANLFFDLLDFILSILETAAGAIDALFGSNLASAVNGWRTSIANWVSETIGDNDIQFDRMEHISYTDAMATGSQMASSFINSLSDFALSTATATELASSVDDIADDTSSIAKSVSATDEDLQALIDMAERQYVNQINLTAQTPVITINGANTGNTAADRQALADAIRDILVEQVAAGSTRTTARAF